MNAIAAAYVAIYKHEEYQRLAEASHIIYVDQEPDFLQPNGPKMNIFQRIAQALHRRKAQEACS